MKKTNLTLLLCALPVLSSVYAETLLTYDFSSSTAPYNTPTSSLANVSGDGLVWFGMTTNRVGFSGSTDSAFAYMDVVPLSFDGTKYMELTINANEGYQLDLESLAFNLGVQNDTGEAFTVYSNVRTNIDSYGADLTINGSTTIASHDVLAPNNNNSTSSTADLSGSQFNNISSLTIRWYPSNSVDETFDSTILRYSAISIIGTVSPIPESSACALIAGGFALCSIMLRRRR